MLLSSYRRLLAVTFRYPCRLLSTEVESIVSPPQERKKRRKKGEEPLPGEKAMSKEMQTYFDSLNMTSSLMKLPQTALKRRNRLPESFYIANEETAEKVAEEVLKDLDKDQTLIEANPGLGFLTERLFEGCSNKMILYEPAKGLHSHLEVSFPRLAMN